MRITFPYPGYENIQAVEVPDRNLVGVFSPKTIADIDENAVLKSGFENPIGAPSLHEIVHGKERILILVDDGTRGTPVHRILPFVFSELHHGGVEDGNIEFLTAQGTHRKMTEQELSHKLGEAASKYKIHQHNWLDLEELKDFGKTSDGTRVTANRLLTEFDFILGIGAIVPHRIKGFSGGAKIAFPGVAGREIQERNQWQAALMRSEDVMGKPENPMRHRIEDAARMVGLDYIVNVVSDAQSKIAGCFTGDLVQAHRAGCKLSGEINAVHLPRRADIVLIDSYPADRDLWQSAKGIYSGTMAVRDGGTIILVSPNPEGVAENHPDVLKTGYRPYQELVDKVNHFHDVIGIAVLADLAQVIDRTDCILASPGIPQQRSEHLGFRYADSTEEALRMALEKQGSQANIAVLHHGGHILPLIEKTDH
jgi:nickel-dependent lactate racemase